jgi:hypothetical protein
MKTITNNYEVEPLHIWNFPATRPEQQTCLQGYIEATYTDLIYAFGEPTLPHGDGYKVQAEWNLLTPNGFATIYDYKQGDSYNGEGNGIPVTKITGWNIGGSNKAVVNDIIKAFQKSITK